MGGVGSGRWGGGPTVESALSLDVRDLFRTGELQRGTDRDGKWTWPDDCRGRATIEVVMCARLADADDAHVRLIHWVGEATVADYRVDLESTAQPFGGVRWWFVCPVTGQRVAKLHLPLGVDRFASRHAYRLGYYTQRASPRDRAIRRMHKMRTKLGMSAGPAGEFKKPLRMRWETYDRKVAQLIEIETKAFGYAAGRSTRSSEGQANASDGR